LRGWWRRSPGPGTTPCSASQLCVCGRSCRRKRKNSRVGFVGLFVICQDLEILKVEQLSGHFAFPAVRFFRNELDFVQLYFLLFFYKLMKSEKHCSFFSLISDLQLTSVLCNPCTVYIILFIYLKP